MRLKDLAPPIIVNLARRSKQNLRPYDSYENALEACKGGYEQDDLVNVVYEKTRRYRDSLLGQHPLVAEVNALHTLVGLSLAGRGNELNVIDFGGACGAHYFLSRSLFGERLNLRWHVVETPKMVSKARELQDGQLEFFDDLQKARRDLNRVDLVFSSGALQYVPRPYSCLEQLTEYGADKIFTTRVALSTLPQEFVVVQTSHLSANGPGPMPQGMQDKVVEYPITFARKDKFEEILSKKYSIRILFHEDKAAYQAENHSIDMYGYFAEIRA